MQRNHRPMKNKILAGLILIVSILSMLFSTQVNAEIRVQCEESFYIIGRNEDLTIPICISGVEYLRGFSVLMTYDTNYLTAEESDLTEGTFLSATGDPTEWLIDGSDGSYTATCGILGVTDGSSGDGTLFSIVVTGICAHAGVNIFLDSVVLRDTLNDPIIPDVIQGTSVQIDAPAYADIKVFLEGAYDADNCCMKTTLNDMLPLTSPYDDALTVSSIPDCIVDWVYVEIRSSLAGSTLAGKSMLLKSDGSLCDPYYCHPGFANVGCGNYYVVVRHRNHLAVISCAACEFRDTGTAEELDLSNSSNIYGTGAIKDLGKSTCGICCGDINGDGYVTTMDYTQWYSAFYQGVSGYHRTDINFDGEVTTEDYTKWYSNFIIGAHSCGVE